MTKKTKYNLSGVFLLVAALFGYHYYAAANAEQQIDRTIQELSQKQPSLTVQYSSIDVAPFSGDITFRDLNILHRNHIERAQRLELDLSYSDFLNINFRGINYGLDHIREAEIRLLRPSYVNRSNLDEIKSDSLHIVYKGNVMDGIRSSFNQSAFTTSHSIEAVSSGLTVSARDPGLSRVTAEEFHYSGSVKQGQTSFWKHGRHELVLDTLSWRPPETIRDNYRFFIRGFGYNADSIPLQSAVMNTEPSEGQNGIHLKSSIKSELALVSGSGNIVLANPLGQSKLNGMRITITNFSESFNRVLKNIEQLLSISLPRNSQGITFQLGGTLGDPRILHGQM